MVATIPSSHSSVFLEKNNAPLPSVDNFHEPTCKPSKRQQKMLDIINKARSQARYCGEEYLHAVDPLTWNCKLEEAAQSHTQDMVSGNFFSHSGSNGLYADSRIDSAGYNWSAYGENLAAGFSSEEDALQGLLSSPGHCRNIMNHKFREFGSARIMNVQKNKYDSYWTHVFGAQF
jgi:uncharacterized protein YkwD